MRPGDAGPLPAPLDGGAPRGGPEALDLRTGRALRSVTSEVERGGWEVAWSDEAAWLTIASPYRVDLRAGIVARAWPWQSLANCENIGGKIVCTR